jgi:hypothetical protein
MVIGRLSIPGLTAAPAPVAATPFVAPLSAALARPTLATTPVTVAPPLSSALARPSVVATQVMPQKLGPSAFGGPDANPVQRGVLGGGGSIPSGGSENASPIPFPMPTPGVSPPPPNAAASETVSPPVASGAQGVIRVIQPAPTSDAPSAPPVIAVDHPSVSDPTQVTPVAQMTPAGVVPVSSAAPVSITNPLDSADSRATAAIVAGVVVLGAAAYFLFFRR